MFNNAILAFCHIPKTAGTSANLMLRRYFGANLMAARHRPNSKQTYLYNDLAADAPQFKKLRCISGHCLKPFVDFREFESRLKWFTFLRDPVKRFISHYVHQQTGDFERHKLGLNEWAEKFDRGNAQVQWIAGEEDLEAAKQIIDEKFAFVGNVKDFGGSIQEFAELMNLESFNTYIPRQQMTIRDTSIRDEILNNFDKYSATIERNTELDQRLMDHVATRNWNSDSKVQVTSSDPPSLFRKVGFRIRIAQFQVKDKLIYGPFVKRSQNPSN